MQLFNGITMGVFDFYRARYEGDNVDTGQLIIDRVIKLQKIKIEIDQIMDNDDNTKEDIEGLNWVLTVDFAKNMHPETAKDLLQKIVEKYNGANIEDILKKQDLPNWLKDLINFLQPIADPLNGYESNFNSVEGGNDNTSENLDAQELNEFKSKVESILRKFENQNDERLTKIRTTLTNIQTVLDKPNGGNVKQLQNFIFSMLGDTENNLIINNITYTEQSFCDGKLSSNTLNWLNQVLEKIDKYIGDVKEAMEVENRYKESVEGQTSQVLDSNNGQGILQGNSELPGGYKKVEGIAVTSFNGVVLYESTSQRATEANTDNVGEQNELDPGKVNFAVEQLKGLWLGENSEVSETVYLMKVWKETYAVRLDGDKCLYPIAVDVNRGQRVFLKNNPSCMQYLKNKVDERVADPDIKIGWNGRNYTIWKGDYNKWLEILPMTIAGDWISKDLSECLAFLNFTNYLRNEPWFDREWDGNLEWKFKNDNPNVKWENDELYVKVKKMDKADYNKGEDSSRTWMHVDLNDFWLDRDSNVMKKFKKYNNREQWEDINHFYNNENNQYHSVDLQGMIAREQKVAQRRAAMQRRRETGVSSRGNWSPVESHIGASVVSETVPQNVTEVKTNSFDFMSYWVVVSQWIHVYESSWQNDGNKTYYLVHPGDGWKVSRLQPPYCVEETTTGPLLVDWKLSSNLSFSPENKLNVCDQWANGLTNQLKEIYKSITDKELPDGVAVSKKDNNYELKWNVNGIDKVISLSGEKFIKNGEILGYKINEPEKWLKVVCYAYENYDDITNGNQLVVTNNNEYGINDDNKQAVQTWLKSLNSGEEEGTGHKLVVLPWDISSIWRFENNGFVFDRGVENNGVIKIWGVEYKNCNDENFSGLGYKMESSGSSNWLTLWNFVNWKLDWNWVKFYQWWKLEWKFSEDNRIDGLTYTFSWNSWSVLKYTKEQNENNPLKWTVTLKNGTSLMVSRSTPEDDYTIEKTSAGYEGKVVDRNTWELMVKPVASAW